MYWYAGPCISVYAKILNIITDKPHASVISININGRETVSRDENLPRIRDFPCFFVAARVVFENSVNSRSFLWGGGVRIHFGCLASRCSVLGSRRVPVLIIGIVIESPTGGVTTYMFIIQLTETLDELAPQSIYFFKFSWGRAPKPPAQTNAFGVCNKCLRH